MLFFQILFCLLWFMLGAALFSFGNAAAWRCCRKISVFKGRSHCPDCGHVLNALDLVPVFGYLLLRGKCRYCGARVSPRYVLTEVLGGICSLLCVARYGTYYGGVPMISLSSGLCILILTLLAAISLADAETMEIPNGLTLSLAVCAALSIPLFPEITLLERAIGVFCVSVPMLILSFAIPGAFGGGDVKLMAASGLLLGWQLNLLALFLGILTGGLWAVRLLIAKKKGRKDAMAFGPYLCFGIAASLLWGAPVVAWYLSLL